MLRKILWISLGDMLPSPVCYSFTLWLPSPFCLTLWCFFTLTFSHTVSVSVSCSISLSLYLSISLPSATSIYNLSRRMCCATSPVSILDFSLPPSFNTFIWYIVHFPPLSLSLSLPNCYVCCPVGYWQMCQFFLACLKKPGEENVTNRERASERERGGAGGAAPKERTIKVCKREWERAETEIDTEKQW